MTMVGGADLTMGTGMVGAARLADKTHSIALQTDADG
jgi:hypothetical protein